MSTNKGVARRLVAWLLTAIALLWFVIALPPTQALAVDDDGTLSQTIDPNQQQGTGKVVLEKGHIDFGPTLATGKWKMQIHDDTGSVSYWRMPSDAVIQVNSKSIIDMPSGSTYSFIGEQPGTPLWVIPQTQNPDVVWVGWNTQEPGVLEQLSKGMTLQLDGIEGPGDLDVYLESGNLGAPQVIWSSKKAYPQTSWIEVNAHTHVNWVFHKEGIYKVKLSLNGTLKNGQTVSDTDTLRFAVGDDTDPRLALPEADSANADSQEQSEETTQSTDDEAANTAESVKEQADAALQEYQDKQAAEDQRQMKRLIMIVGGALGAVVVICAAMLMVSSRMAKKRAIAAQGTDDLSKSPSNQQNPNQTATLDMFEEHEHPQARGH